MECLIGGAFLGLLFVGFLLWLQAAIQAKQVQGQPAPARSRPEYGGTTRTVRSTPRQRATPSRTKESDRAIATARRQSLKGLPKGTVHYERIKPVDYEGRKVNAMCLNEQGEITGFVDLGTMPLDWE